MGTDLRRKLLRRQCVPLEQLEIFHAEGGKFVLSEKVPPFGFVLYKIRNIAKKAY
jgi:hypothetical protein